MTITNPTTSMTDVNESKPYPGTIKQSGLTRIIRAGGYSLQGLRSAFAGEAAFRQEFLLAVVTLPIAAFLPIGMVERVLIVAVTCLVLIVELLNSAIEAVVDRIGLEEHPLSGRAKDIGSAAVLVTLLLWGYVWIAILYALYLQRIAYIHQPSD